MSFRPRRADGKILSFTMRTRRASVINVTQTASFSRRGLRFSIRVAWNMHPFVSRARLLFLAFFQHSAPNGKRTFGSEYRAWYSLISIAPEILRSAWIKTKGIAILARVGYSAIRRAIRLTNWNSNRSIWKSAMLTLLMLMLPEWGSMRRIAGAS